MVRYLLQQPKKLESLVLTKLGQYIALRAENLVPQIAELRQSNAFKAEILLSQQIEVIRNHFIKSMPSALHDEMLRKTKEELLCLERKLSVIEGDDTPTHVIGRIIETVFTKYVTFISLSWDNIFLPSLCSKSHILSGLIHLRINNSRQYMDPFAPMLPTEILKLLKELKNLKYLYLNWCTDNILRCIAENCELLEVLEITQPHYYSTFISDDSIEILIKLRNLRSINLEESKVTQKGIEVLLLSCTNIEHIAGTPFLASALEHVTSTDGNAEKLFKLKSFENTHQTTLKQLELLVQRCPLIEKLYIDGCPRDESRYGLTCCINDTSPTHYRYNLQVFNDLKNLRTLTLRNYYFYYDKINKVLLARGYHLVTLVLYVYDVDLSALKYILKMCPNLQTLDLDLVVHYEEANIWTIMRNSLKQIKAYVTDFFRNEKEIPSLKKLKKLHLNIDKNEPLQEEFIILMLSSCPNVEIIEIGYYISLTDDIMLKVLDINPLASLKELNLWKSELSKLFLDRIVQNCVNPPVLLHYV